VAWNEQTNKAHTVAGRRSAGKTTALHVYDTLLDVIDLRSFSNLWFWIVLAVLWSSISHWVIGVPFDMVGRARQQGGEAERDLEELVRINSNRIQYIVTESGLWIAAILSAVLTGLVLLGFVYDIELAQAVFLLAFPMTLVGLLGVHTSYKVQNGEGQGEALWRRMRIHRVITQFIGMASIFITAIWGMSQNLSAQIIG
jgi:uncharacterized membrane protein YecN with MAPEG domain